LGLLHVMPAQSPQAYNRDIDWLPNESRRGGPAVLQPLNLIPSILIMTLNIDDLVKLRGGILPLKTWLFIKYPFSLCLCMVNGEYSEYQRCNTLGTTPEI
jgi:hypothetical protein